MSRIILKDAYKKDTSDQDKILAPGETVKRFREKLQTLNLKILDQAVRIDNGRLDIPVFFSICGPDALSVTGTQKQMGKGATPQQAEASAVMELAERFSFFSFWQNEKHFTRASYSRVKDRAIPFEQIAASVHDKAEDLDRAQKVFETLPLKWAAGYNLTQNREVLIPFDWFYAVNEFNGSCAGNCPEEALNQGICEVVERHVSSLISHKRLRVPAILPESADDAMTVDMLKKYTRAGIRLWISDFTLNTGIPTVGVLAYDPETFPKTSEIVWTAGTTPNPQKALSRALSETAQLAGDFNSGSNYVASGLPKFSRLEEADFITWPDRLISLADLPDLSNDNIRIEIENLLSALSCQSQEVLAVDTTHPLLQVPAFYVIVPGAHFRERALNSSVGMFCAKHIAENRPSAEAIAELSRMEGILPRKYYLRFYLGICHLAIDEPQTALAYLEQALELNPAAQDIPSIYSYMGVCLKEMGKFREALDVLEKGEALDPDRTDIPNLKGFCWYRLKEHERAIACFERVLQLNPGSAIDYANIASNYRDLGQKEKAIYYYEMALTLDSSIEFARDNLKKLKSSVD
jgi:ribosomal protein S12 methylthiotransferase accessory factor